MKQIKNKTNYKAISIGLMLMTGLAPSVVSAQATLAERKQKAEQVQTLFNMAEKAYKDGDINVARDTLRIVLDEQPGHAHATALLRKIQLNGSQFELAKKKRIFNSVILKQVDYKEVNLAQALKILNQQVMTASDEKVVPNFVLSDPKKYLGDERLELQMNNVPAGVVLDHLLKKAGATAKFGKYSITVTPRPSANRVKAKAAEEVEEE